MSKKQNKLSIFKKFFEASCWIELVILLTTSASENAEYEFRVAAENRAGIGEPSLPTKPVKVVKPIAKQTCDVPSVQVDKATTLTCTFDVDVTVYMKSIIILHYRENSPGDPATVVYNALFDEKFQYLTHPGYTILGNISNTLVVRIDRVTRNHIGRYECHIVPSAPGDAEPCNFWITDVVIDTPTTSEPKDSTILIHVPGNYEDLEKLHYVWPVLITVCCALFLILVGLTVAVVIMCRRTRQKSVASKDGYKVNIVADNDSKTKQEEALLAE